MAWRIEDSVIRGEIDNREPNVIRGKLWLQDIPEPVLLDLAGNACADLAGCLLTFENTKETFPMRPDAKFWPVQTGTAGDVTASRKVRVFPTPFEEDPRPKKKQSPAPALTANCLYLEWFSQDNGRVVIESSDFRLTVSPPAWRLSPEDEARRQQQSTDGFNSFMQKLTQAVEAQRHEPPEEKEWDEFDYEKFMRESDARTDKYSELLDKYMDHPDRDKIIAKEMGWAWLEEALEEQEENEKLEASGKETNTAANADDFDDPDDTGEAEDPAKGGGWEFPDDINDMTEALKPDPATEGVDWVSDKEGYHHHPLALRAQDGAMDLWHKCKAIGLGKKDDPDLSRLISEYQTTSAKLAGALNSLAYGRDLRDSAFIVAYLKRALNYLHAAQAALERVNAKNILPPDLNAVTRTELFGLREEILKLMQEFRKK